MPTRLSGRFLALQIRRQCMCSHTHTPSLTHMHMYTCTPSHSHMQTHVHTHSGVALAKIFILGAKSLQSCPTLWDPMDCNPPGSSVHGIRPGKNTEVGCHFLLQGIFPTQGSNLSLLWLLECRWILYHWATREALILGTHVYWTICYMKDKGPLFTAQVRVKQTIR